MKALFFDVDGTLVNSDNEIQKSAYEAIAETRKNGNLVFVNSGRCYGMMTQLMEKIEIDGWLCGCGTEIVYRGESVYNNELSYDLKKRIVEAADKYNIEVIAEGHNGATFSVDENGSRMKDMKATIELIRKSEAYTGEKFSPDFNMAKFCIQADENSDIEGLKAEFSNEFDIMDRYNGFYECVPLGHSKGTAVDCVLKKFDLDKKDAYVFGDSTNDLSMFKTGANAIAMKKHDVELEEYATYITDTVENDGVYKAMKHFGLI
jgi:Cof subfamily protein (haloacid dehalogenase superfamily)